MCIAHQEYEVNSNAFILYAVINDEFRTCGVARMNRVTTALNRELSQGDRQRRSGEHQTRPEAIVTGRGARRQNGQRIHEYRPGSWQSHLLFGLGTLALMALPPLLPGMTTDLLLKGYLGFLAVSYGIICVWGIARGLAGPHAGAAQRARHNHR